MPYIQPKSTVPGHMLHLSNTCYYYQRTVLLSTWAWATSGSGMMSLWVGIARSGGGRTRRVGDCMLVGRGSSKGSRDPMERVFNWGRPCCTVLGYHFRMDLMVA